MFPWIHPLGCDVASSPGRVYSRQATVLNCVKSPVSFVMEHCPFSTTLRSPSPIQNLLEFILLWQLLNSLFILLEWKNMLGHHSPMKLLSWSHWSRLIAPSPLWSLRSYNKIAVLQHFRILNAADAERFHDAFKTSSWFRAVKTPCGDQLPSHRRHFGQLE